MTRCHYQLLCLVLTSAALLNSPQRSAAQQRDDSNVPGVVIDYSAAKRQQYIGSPSLAVLPSGEYVASHDFFGPGSTYRKAAESVVFNSTDRGQTWQPISRIKGMFWGKLFVHRGRLYLLGTTYEYGAMVIRRSDDGGRSWTTPTNSTNGLLRAEGQYHCAPVPVVVHEGRIWRGFEDKSEVTNTWGGEYFRATVISAPVEADLLDARSWTTTNRISSDSNWLGGTLRAWLEGNVVVAPDRRIVNILRVDTPTGGKAAVVRISADGRTAQFDPAKDFIDFPGGAKKFAIHYDAKTKLYWSLVSYVKPEYLGNTRAASIRNTLALTSSENLRDWKLRSILLHHHDVRKTGFQYVDWQFEGPDIIAVSRTGYDDGVGGAHNAHDANYLTFHRIENFRRRTLDDPLLP